MRTKYMAISFAILIILTIFALASCQENDTVSILGTESFLSETSSIESQTDSVNRNNTDASLDTSETSDIEIQTDSPNQNNTDVSLDTSEPEDNVSNSAPDINTNKKKKSNGTLVVNEKDISKEHYVCFDSENESAMIPFLAIMEEFGSTVTWIDENNANVHFVDISGNAYDAVLNTKRGTFVRDDIDYFRVAPQNVVEYDVVDGEFLVDSEDCFIFFYYNYGTSFERDWKNKTIVMYRNDYEKKAKLIVNGTDITENHHVVLNYGVRTAELPLVAIMSNLGAQVTWINDTQANVIINGEEYILDINPANALSKTEASFKNIKTQTEYFDFYSAALLGVCYSGVENGEFFISVSCIRNIKTLMNIVIDVDYENAVVYINTIE